VQVRHAGLKVADLERTRAFYVDALGFNVMLQTDVLMLISAGGYHHDMSFWARESRGGEPAPPQATGLDHIAFLYPDKATLADALRRLADVDCPIEYISEFPAHVGVHVRDPDGNMIELQYDKPVEEWVMDEHGHLPPTNKFISVEDLGLDLGDVVLRQPDAPAPRPLDAE
jgi:catechol 2,3-dioxygenase